MWFLYGFCGVRESGRRAVDSFGQGERHNPLGHVTKRPAYVTPIDGLVLSGPRIVDVAVLANRKCSLAEAA